MPKAALPKTRIAPPSSYTTVRGGIVRLLDHARSYAARQVNALMTACYWEIGRRIVEAEQDGHRRAGYGEALIAKLSVDLSAKFGRGFGENNLENMRNFYLNFRHRSISQTVSGKLGASDVREISQTVSGKSTRPANVRTALVPATLPSASTQVSLSDISDAFPLPWSAYVRLLTVKDEYARGFYETEALRGGWSVRQLDRQINTQFYERTALSKNKAAMLMSGAKTKPQDLMSADDAIKDPFFLEFLNLKDEYSETDLENALVHRLEDFLLELGDEFSFIGRQRRLRIDHVWYRVDLLFYHRRLRCLVVIDLKLGELTHADVGQMHMYCNYAKAHWALEGENPPVGLILCAHKGQALARYAMDGLPSKIMATQYKTALPDVKLIEQVLVKTRLLLDQKKQARKPSPQKPSTQRKKHV